MRHQISLCSIILGLAGLVACAENTTQPTPSDEPVRALASDRWIRRADMWSIERQDLAVAAVSNAAGQSIVYAIGGRSATGAPLGKMMAYNVATNSWTLKRSLPQPTRSLNQAAVLNGKIYVSGGCNHVACAYDPPSSRLYVYDPSTDTWTRKQDIPGVRDPSGVLLFSGTSGVSGVIAGKLYVLSECYYGDAPLFYNCDPSLFFRYSRVTDRWTALPRPSGTYRMGGVIGGKFYVARIDIDPQTGQRTLRTEVYDPGTNRWSVKASSPAVVGDAAASVALRGELFVIGGRLFRQPDGPIDSLRTVMAYNPATDAWTRKARLPVPAWGSAATRILVDGQARIEVVGGSPPGNNLQYVP